MAGFFWFAFVFLAIPASGIGWYLHLVGEMDRRSVPKSPKASLFAVFAGYGLAFIYAITLAFGWSGMHVLGTVALLFLVGPFLTAQAFVLWRRRTKSGFHLAVFVLSAGFYPALVVLFMVGGGIHALVRSLSTF